MTPNELIRDWLREQDSPRTAEQYARAFTLFIPWFERETGRTFSLKDWTALDTKAFRDVLREKQQSAATINNRLAALASFVTWAIERGHMQHNPVAGVKRIKQQKRPVRVLERNESNALQRAIELLNPQERFTVQFLLNTGLRVSEFCNLHLQDVWLGERRETLDQLLGHLPAKTLIGEVIVRDGKGHKEREVPLNADARQALLAYLSVRPPIEDPHLLISLRHKCPVGPHSVQKLLRVKIGGTSRLPGLHPHLFRAETATRLGRAGIPIQTIANVLGHSSIQTTHHYLGELDGERRAAMEKIATSEE